MRYLQRTIQWQASSSPSGDNESLGCLRWNLQPHLRLAHTLTSRHFGQGWQICPTYVTSRRKLYDLKKIVAKRLLVTKKQSYCFKGLGLPVNHRYTSSYPQHTVLVIKSQPDLICQQTDFQLELSSLNLKLQNSLFLLLLLLLLTQSRELIS